MRYESLIKDIIQLLEDRKGFDDWWYGIDSYTQQEIMLALDECVDAWMIITELSHED